jgi:hypothetical protein
MYLVNIDSKLSSIDSRVELQSDVVALCETIYSDMDSDETFWMICSNQYGSNGCWSVGLDLANSIREEVPLILKNTITVHIERETGGELDSIYKEILFFVKNKREYKFNKDAIRIPHIYKGNEWGGEREKGSSSYHDTEVRRYNPDGKDPGNVWMREDRTLTEDESVDMTGSIAIEEAIQRCVRAGSDDDETVYTVGIDSLDEIDGRDIEILEVEKWE